MIGKHIFQTILTELSSLFFFLSDLHTFFTSSAGHNLPILIRMHKDRQSVILHLHLLQSFIQIRHRLLLISVQFSDPALEHAYLSDKSISRQIHLSAIIKPNYTFLVHIHTVSLLSASAQLNDL